MAKFVWEGHLRLSLVTCPVALYKATDTKGGIGKLVMNMRERICSLEPRLPGRQLEGAR